MLPADLLDNVLQFLDAGDIKNLHQTCSQMRDDTTGVVPMTKRELFHYEMGNRIHQLELQQEYLMRCYYDRKRGSRGSSELFRKCIMINPSCVGDRVFVDMKGLMDSVASIEGVPMKYYGHPDGDVYYRRHEELENPITVSEGKTFTREDVEGIRGYLDDLIAIHAEVQRLTSFLLDRDDFYARSYQRLVRDGEVLRRRRQWLHKKYSL